MGQGESPAPLEKQIKKGLNTMKTNSLDLYFDRKALYAKSDALRAELETAEEEDSKLWKWYEGMTEEEYHACEAEADAKVKKSSEACKNLREHLKEVENAIRLMEKLEDSLQYLETEKVV